MAQVQGMQQMAAPTRAQSIKKLTNFLGAAISVGLVVGIGVWGYKLLVRDVSGVPVVRAAEGPMRVQPEEPGGAQALNQGLAVNNVAAEGTAEDPADRLVLAPEPLELSLEDEPIVEVEETEHTTPSAEAGEPVPETEEDNVQFASVDALVAQIIKDAEPLDDIQTATTDDTSDIAETPKVAGGLSKSLRPLIRPASLSTAPQPAMAVTTAESVEVDAGAVPTGTRLAQLGAFESAEIARSEWQRLSGKFGEYLEGKNRVVQKAKSGGRTFYRLRAMGFADLNDARRFCSALVAENAECIPVVTR
ncbi:SPOR domain-containing protein [uncultured Roseovarius sp.]|uniref:SPOR domain-containing protein n=1 Tax=uncultured Roseovarius sp. TaxID=293344 RepID=UPI00261F636F|nr:SPOR domain-containing protein [uncultured Roseovarius sp.]